jgi:hypothetical protein
LVWVAETDLVAVTHLEELFPEMRHKVLGMEGGAGVERRWVKVHESRLLSLV